MQKRVYAWVSVCACEQICSCVPIRIANAYVCLCSCVCLRAHSHASACMKAYTPTCTHCLIYSTLTRDLLLQKGAPLRLHMWGINLYTGGHFDDYIADYYGFEPGPPEANVYNVPDYCPPHPSTAESYVVRHQMRQNGVLRHLHAMLPNPHYGARLLSCTCVGKGGERSRPGGQMGGGGGSEREWLARGRNHLRVV